MAQVAGIPDTAVAKRLYYDSPALDFAAHVTDIRLVATEQSETGAKSHVWQVALDRTAFYPEGGGQPWDVGVLIATARSGARLEVAVERVLEDEAGEIWHQIRKPLEQGTSVDGQVQAARRRDHMQQHSGQHLLSAVFLQRLGAKTVSFHLGTENATIDLALPPDSAGLTLEQMADAEDEVNRLIFENRTLTPRWHSRAESEAMLARGDLRKLPERPGQMRVVEMAGVEWNACGGTHVASTGAIGGLLLRGTENVKGGVRVKFVCGLRAVKTTREEHRALTEAAGALSVAAVDVPGRVEALQGEVKASAKEGRALLEEIAGARAESLMAATPERGVAQAIFLGKPIEFAKRMASACAASGRRAVIGTSQGSTGAVALAVPAGSGFNAGAILRETLAPFSARGGGSSEMAQGVCTSAQLAEVLAAVVARLA